MEIKPDFNRLLKAIHHEEGDRVPLCELLIDYTHQSRFLGRKVSPDDMASQVEFWTKAGYDFIPITVGMMPPGKVTKEAPIVQVIRETMLKDSPDKEDEKSWNIELGHGDFITNKEEFELFPWEVAAQLDFTKLEAVGNLLPPGMKVIAMSGKIFTLAWMLMGFNNFSMALVLDEKLVAEVIEKVADIQLKALDRILGLPHVGAVWVVDDVAFGTGPIISPKALKKHVFSWYSVMARRCHQKGLPLIMHSDGDMRSLIPDLIEIGLDALHPIDPNCMDIREIKKEYGRDLCLIGNVPNEMLRSGTPDEIKKTVMDLIREVAPGGGFCIGSGNSVPDWASFENYEAMRRASLEHGRYPIST